MGEHLGVIATGVALAFTEATSLKRRSSHRLLCSSPGGGVESGGTDCGNVCGSASASIGFY